MAKYLITGGLGFIGSHLVDLLLRAGHDLIIVDNFDETLYPRRVKDDYLFQRMRQESPGSFIHAPTDVSEPGLLELLQLDRGDGAPDAIIHLAALAGVRPSLKDPGRYAQVNVVGTTRVFDLARRIGCPRVICASSSSVYGKLMPPFTESMNLTEIVSPYALSKRQAELTADYYTREYGIQSVSLRFFTVYGERQRTDMFIRRALTMIDRGEEITLYGDGSSFRDYTHVEDIVNGVALLLSSFPEEHPALHRIYNIGCGDPITLLDLVKAMGEVVGKGPRVRHIEDQKGDVPGTLADISRMRELGYEPQVNIQDGLERMWAWMTTQG